MQKTDEVIKAVCDEFKRQASVGSYVPEVEIDSTDDALLDGFFNLDSVARAAIAAHDTVIQQALDDQVARIVVWLHDRHDGKLVSQIAIAEAIEQGEWQPT